MTKRHFQMIADVISDPTLSLSDDQRLHIAMRFVDKLADENPRFDRVRFVRACGVDV